jgi:hypothetical protein
MKGETGDWSKIAATDFDIAAYSWGISLAFLILVVLNEPSIPKSLHTPFHTCSNISKQGSDFLPSQN